MRAHERVLAIQASLTSRDLRLMSWLYDHGVLTTPQITHALFTSASFAQRRLLHLLQLGVLARFRPQKPDGGSYPYHWLLDQAGVEVVAAQRGDPIPRPGQARARRLHLTSRANLPHLLGVNGFFTALAAHERTHPGSVLAEWWPAVRFTEAGAFFQADDDISVSFIRLRPDGYGVWAEHDAQTRQGVRVGFYVEYDTGAEPLATLVDKAGRYLRLWAGKAHPSPALFLLPTAVRELHLHQKLADSFQPGRLPVLTSSLDLLAASGASPAEAVWWLYGDEDGRRPLVELPAARAVEHGDHGPPAALSAAEGGDR